MSTIPTSQDRRDKKAGAQPAPRRDWRDRRRHWAGGALVLAGAALVTVFTQPKWERDDPQSFVSYVHDHATLMTVVQLLGLVVALAVVPGMAGLAHSLRRTRPLLGYLGAGLTIFALVAYVGVMATDAANRAVVETGAPLGTVTKTLDASTNTVFFNTLFLVFLVGHVVGPVLLGIGVGRAGLVPWAVALLLPVGAVGHFVAEASGSRVLDVVAFVALGVGWLLLGVRLLRRPVDA